MSRIDDLKPDQRAALQLLLKQGRSYEEIAQMLRIETRAVRERARAALDALGPEDAADDLALEEQDDVADYLLGQQSASRRASTRELLERSAPARAWARTVSSELRPLAGDALPEIPAEAAEVDEAFGALQARTEHRERTDKSSRVGGAILLFALALLIVGIIVIALGGGDNDGDDNPAAGGTGTTQTQTGTGTNGNAAPAGQVRLLSQANLNPAGGASGGDGPAGVAFYSREGQNGKFGVAVQAEGLEPSTENRFYAIWLTGPNTGNRFVGFDEDGVARDGILQGARELDYDPRKYTTALVTRETQAAPKQPGETVLRGRFQEVPADAQDGQPGPGAAQPPAEGEGGAQAPAPDTGGGSGGG